MKLPYLLGLFALMGFETIVFAQSSREITSTFTKQAQALREKALGNISPKPDLETGLKSDAFAEFKHFLENKDYRAFDGSNTLTEKINIIRSKTLMVIDQTLSSESKDGIVVVDMQWRLTIPLLLAAKPETHEVNFKNARIDFVSAGGSRIFPYSSITTYMTNDGRSASDNKSDKAEKFGFNFMNNKEADDFLVLYKHVTEELTKHPVDTNPTPQLPTE
jgi:hypothetical protein